MRCLHLFAVLWCGTDYATYSSYIYIYISTVMHWQECHAYSLRHAYIMALKFGTMLTSNAILVLDENRCLTVKNRSILRHSRTSSLPFSREICKEHVYTPGSLVGFCNLWWWKNLLKAFVVDKTRIRPQYIWCLNQLHSFKCLKHLWSVFTTQ